MRRPVRWRHPGAESRASSRVKLLLDEMWPPVIAEQLRRRGFYVDAVAERPELRGQSDDVIFVRAQAEERALVTENVGDYRRIATYRSLGGSTHFGLIFTIDRRFPRSDSRTLGRMVTALDDVLSREADLTGREYWLS